MSKAYQPYVSDSVKLGKVKALADKMTKAKLEQAERIRLIKVNKTKHISKRQRQLQDDKQAVVYAQVPNQDGALKIMLNKLDPMPERKMTYQPHGKKAKQYQAFANT